MRRRRLAQAMIAIISYVCFAKPLAGQEAQVLRWTNPVSGAESIFLRFQAIESQRFVDIAAGGLEYPSDPIDTGTAPSIYFGCTWTSPNTSFQGIFAYFGAIVVDPEDQRFGTRLANAFRQDDELEIDVFVREGEGEAELQRWMISENFSGVASYQRSLAFELEDLLEPRDYWIQVAAPFGVRHMAQFRLTASREQLQSVADACGVVLAI